MRTVRPARLLIFLSAAALMCAPAAATRDLSVKLGSTLADAAVTAGPDAVSNILPGRERKSHPTSPYGVWVAIVLTFGLLGAVSRRRALGSQDETSF